MYCIFFMINLLTSSFNYLLRVHDEIVEYMQCALYYQARNSAFNLPNSNWIAVYVRLQFSSCTQLNATTVLHRHVSANSYIHSNTSASLSFSIV